MNQEQLQRFEEMESKINKLYDVYFSNDFPDNHVFNKKVTVTDFLKVKGITLVSGSNTLGCQILTGNAQNTTLVNTEYPNAPNGSIYLSSSTSGLNFFIKYMNAWNFINIP